MKKQAKRQTTRSPLKDTIVAASVAAVAVAPTTLPMAVAKPAGTGVQVAQDNPCNAAKPFNPCSPSSANNPCNPCNPCAAGRWGDYQEDWGRGRTMQVPDPCDFANRPSYCVEYDGKSQTR